MLRECLSMIFSPWVLPFVAYGIFLLYDWNTPKRGGYGNRITTWFRSLRILRRFFVDYFPARLHKTADLPTGTNYLIITHPHGLFNIATHASFSVDVLEVSRKFPGLNVRQAVLEPHFHTPLRREYILLLGKIGCSKESLCYLLDTDKALNNAVVLSVGGVAEMLNARPGCPILTLKNRKGFVRTALETGAQLVPSYSFGELELYDQVDNPEGSRMRMIQNFMKKWTGSSPILFNGRYIVFPRRIPLNTVVGAPIFVTKMRNPTTEEVDDLHRKYMDALEELYESNKRKFGVPPEERLTFV